MNKQELLNRYTRHGQFFDSAEGGRVRCYACGHDCNIQPGHAGICKVRYNSEGHLMVPWGYVAGLAIDPIEKKPFFHFLPGAKTLSFGMLGCNFKCPFCQNWESSQVLKDDAAGSAIQPISADEIISIAKSRNIKIIISTYNEPMITSEWALEIFRLAKGEGLRTGFVSNGFGTPRIVEKIAPFVDCWNVDLKSFREEFYRMLGGRLKNVCDTIRAIHSSGIWCEIVTLLVPDGNSSLEELHQIAGYVASVDPEMPWHVSGFHPDYRMESAQFTPAELLLKAAEIGRGEGLRHVYAGNLPGRVSEWENTRCPKCDSSLVERRGFHVKEYHIKEPGSCPACGERISGVWC